jgi:hypothetical protein
MAKKKKQKGKKGPVHAAMTMPMGGPASAMDPAAMRAMMTKGKSKKGKKC